MEIYGANIKMNPVVAGTNYESEQAVLDLLKGYVEKNIKATNEKEILVFLPVAFLSAASRLDLNGIKLGCQRISAAEQGTFTGETSPIWLNNYGITEALVAHSEVRKHYDALGASPDELFIAEIKNALAHGLRVTYCVGETKEQREHGNTKAVISEQLKVLYGIDTESIIIAYEPVWAISDGKTPAPIPTSEEIESAHGLIKEKYPAVLVLYGGSMNPKNVKDIMDIAGVDGGLIGGASLKAESFSETVNH